MFSGVDTKQSTANWVSDFCNGDLKLQAPRMLEDAPLAYANLRGESSFERLPTVTIVRHRTILSIHKVGTP